MKMHQCIARNSYYIGWRHGLIWPVLFLRNGHIGSAITRRCGMMLLYTPGWRRVSGSPVHVRSIQLKQPSGSPRVVCHGRWVNSDPPPFCLYLRRCLWRIVSKSAIKEGAGMNDHEIGALFSGIMLGIAMVLLAVMILHGCRVCRDCGLCGAQNINGGSRINLWVCPACRSKVYGIYDNKDNNQQEESQK